MPDINYTFELDIVSTQSFEQFWINQTYTFEVSILSECSVEVQASKLIDLLQMVPEKFRSSPLFQDYVSAVGLYLGTWLAKIDDMKYLVDPWNVSDELKTVIPGQEYVADEEYISHLASLIGLTITKNTGQTITDFRRQLLQAIDWYKLKGSYKALSDAIYITNQNIQIKDLYTNNYVTFIPEDWFVADYPGQNPPDLDSSYYKSPHFGLQIELNQMYQIPGGRRYLWQGDDKFSDVRGYVEQIRPANTVPHYIVHMTAPTNESGVMTTTSYGVATKRLYEPWVFSRFYFDQHNIPGQVDWNLDDGKFFDYSNTSFLSSINKWKLGTGSKYVTPDVSGWNIETPVLSGTIPSTLIRLFSDRSEYDIVLDPSIVQAEISELAMYLPDGTTLVIGSTFPDIDKIAGVELRITVILYK
jgi:hypothetical protein